MWYIELYRKVKGAYTSIGPGSVFHFNALGKVGLEHAFEYTLHTLKRLLGLLVEFGLHL
jgi:hypothetical protein